MAAAYFRASPGALPHLSGPRLARWATMGQRLYRGNWKSISLSSVFFSASPGLLGQLSLDELERLVTVVDTLADRSYELATSCLDAAPNLFSMLERRDRRAFLDFATVISQSSWADARLYFEKGHTSLAGIDPDCRGSFLGLSARVAERVGRQGYPLFAEASAALKGVDQSSHHHLIALAEELAAASPVAAMEFLKSAPDVLRRVRMEDLAAWHDAGHRILVDSEEGGEAYFRLESGKGEQFLDNLSSRLELSRVSEVLRLYCQALTGVPVSIHAASALAEKGIGWVSEAHPTTEGKIMGRPFTIDCFIFCVISTPVWRAALASLPDPVMPLS